MIERCRSHGTRFEPLTCRVCALIEGREGLAEGREARDDGIELVTSNNEGWVDRARSAMRQVCRQRLTVSAVDLQRWADSANDRPKHPNAFGAVFRSGEWQWTGELTQCRHSLGHARAIKIWTLKELW